MSFEHSLGEVPETLTIFISVSFLIVRLTTVGFFFFSFAPALCSSLEISCPLLCFLCETLIDDKGTMSSGTLVTWRYVSFAGTQLNYISFLA